MKCNALFFLTGLYGLYTKTNGLYRGLYSGPYGPNEHLQESVSKNMRARVLTLKDTDGTP